MKTKKKNTYSIDYSNTKDKEENIAGFFTEIDKPGYPRRRRDKTGRLLDVVRDKYDRPT
tara:strand:+ start:1990 stop:2166 length:177 start_codon:yes stop_codon:yes gene_type:complete